VASMRVRSSFFADCPSAVADIISAAPPAATASARKDRVTERRMIALQRGMIAAEIE
jgi:hypothetical protein